MDYVLAKKILVDVNCFAKHLYVNEALKRRNSYPRVRSAYLIYCLVVLYYSQLHKYVRHQPTYLDTNS